VFDWLHFRKIGCVCQYVIGIANHRRHARRIIFDKISSPIGRFDRNANLASRIAISRKRQSQLDCENGLIVQFAFSFLKPMQFALLKKFCGEILL
jgi:hypothetical protein